MCMFILNYSIICITCLTLVMVTDGTVIEKGSKGIRKLEIVGASGHHSEQPGYQNWYASGNLGSIRNLQGTPGNAWNSHGHDEYETGQRMFMKRNSNKANEAKQSTSHNIDSAQTKPKPIQSVPSAIPDSKRPVVPLPDFQIGPDGFISGLPKPAATSTIGAGSVQFPSGLFMPIQGESVSEKKKTRPKLPKKTQSDITNKKKHGWFDISRGVSMKWAPGGHITSERDPGFHPYQSIGVDFK